MAEIPTSTCENPHFPNWMWRYNRNKCLSRFEPWYTRAERWPPHYRHMGVHDGFEFHPPEEPNEDQPFQRLGISYAHHLVNDRQAGFGNAALGCSPGPAPPRFIILDEQSRSLRPDDYKLNVIDKISEGMSPVDHTKLPPVIADTFKLPLDPRQYLQETLGQRQEYPGTFPHRSIPIPSTSKNVPRKCGGSNQARKPMDIWLQKYRNRMLEAVPQGALPPQSRPPLRENPCRVDPYEGMRPPAQPF